SDVAQIAFHDSSRDREFTLRKSMSLLVQACCCHQRCSALYGLLKLVLAEEDPMARETNDKVTRLQLFQLGAGIGGSLVLVAKAWSASPKPQRAFEHGNPLKEFNYGQVKLHAGPHQAQLEQTHTVLMALDEDSLMRPFRMAADRPAPGRDLGGWYSGPSW